VNNYKNNELYFYKNLGFTKRNIWIFSLTLDFIIFIFAMFAAYKLKIALGFDFVPDFFN